ncbi:hypothetical protein FB45DRAFT_925321 [Roridomyces roridus]|uniref:Prolyl 4-hydroxylase alpha subunit Fe(2+) 2OG dioxygenase domain-containing protein n=1 Tax=Roridomyces roridus TaxID=1738132 RepID=A0AAD7BK92_9AGAR|nr:hypothetical protein FB45DRAFT_925321 [Roridomyces roridus]
MDRDISAALSRTLASDLDFQGEFAFHKTLQDLGIVGLPLSPAVAQQVIAKCVQAPFGKGERTVVDKDVRDTWEMDALKVQFCNPAWNTFMDRVIREVCATLGVNFDASKPRAELYKLLVYETGSHSEKANGMFASIIVVLPSQFEGGDAYTSHAGVKRVFKSSRIHSMNHTSVLAWYTDVLHEIKPITSGFRFVLAYNLVHTTTSLRPALSSTDGATAKLRKIFHNYSMANLSASALKGSDAHIMALLDTLAKEIGFSLGLANLELRQSGAADDDGHDHYRRDKYGYGEEDSEDDQEVDFMEISDTTLEVSNFVDPEGHPIDDCDLQVDDDGSLQEEITANGDYEQDYEGYMGNVGHYRHSVLVIWPRWSSLGGGNSDRRAIGGLERLQMLDGDKPTAQELEDFQYLCGSVKYMTDEQETAMERLFGAAVTWNDVNLWTAACKACCGPDMSLSSLTEEDLQDACANFGFGVLAHSLGPVIVGHNSNVQRLEFIQSLQGLIGADEDSSESAEIDAFVTKMRTEVLDNLRQYSSAEELKTFTNEILTEGGAQMLRDRLLPQIEKLATVHNLVHLGQYLDWLHDLWTTNTAPVDDADKMACKEVITKLLEIIMRMKELFIPKTTNVTSDAHRSIYARQPPVPEGDPSTAIALIGQCLDYDNPQLAVKLVDQISTSAVQHANDPVKGQLVPGILLSLVPAAKRMFETCKPPLEAPVSLNKMAGTAIDTKFRLLAGTGLTAVKKEDVACMLDVAKGLDNAGALLERVISGLKALPWSDEGWAACLEEFHGRRTIGSSDLFNTLVPDMSKTYADKVALQRSAGYYGSSAHLSIEQLSPIMKLCYETGGAEVFSTLMGRVLGSTMPVESHLVPLILILKEMAGKYRVDLAVAPFASPIRDIVSKWMAVVLGKKPKLEQVKQYAEEVKKIRCSCAHCLQVVRFLQSPDQESSTLSRIGANAVKHVIGLQVGRMGRFVQYETVRTTPQSLKVQKNAEIVRASRWKGLLAKGRQVLQSIGDDPTLRNIWGNAYVSALGPLLTKEQLEYAQHPRKAAPVDPRDIIEIDSD